MSLGRKLDETLERDGTGTIRATDDGRTAEVDVVEADRLGVRVRRVRVGRDTDADVGEVAHALPDRLRHLSERVEPVEVDPGLGGAVLRTHPDDMRDREFFQVDVTPRETELRRYRAGDDGREAVDWTLTREQLGRLVDDLS